VGYKHEEEMQKEITAELFMYIALLVVERVTYRKKKEQKKKRNGRSSVCLYCRLNRVPEALFLLATSNFHGCN
jgi:hypothetical protein